MSENEPQGKPAEMGVMNEPGIRVSCCKEFVKQAKLWHVDDGIESCVERDGSVSWRVPGCCGGCYVLRDLRHCPWCGKPLPVAAPDREAPDG